MKLTKFEQVIVILCLLVIFGGGFILGQHLTEAKNTQRIIIEIVPKMWEG